MIDEDVAPNPEGVITKVIPAARSAVARHLGSRSHNAAAVYLYGVWLPQSGEEPGVREDEMYLPLRPLGERCGRAATMW
ncbi:MAG: GyrI-like domain-containing protein [Gemmataceae bacterium]